MNIDGMEFIAWMERIEERFDILMEAVSRPTNLHTKIDGDELLDNQDILQILKLETFAFFISTLRRTRQNLNKNNNGPNNFMLFEFFTHLIQVVLFIKPQFTLI
jgi:hypothetical protein